MTQKVWMFHKNGNSIIQRNKELEKVREHIYYYVEKNSYNYEDYYIVVENKGEYFMQGHVSWSTIEKATWEQMLKNIEGMIANESYFNLIDLKLLATISDELYQRGLHSKEICLQRREKNRLEQQERERQERKKREKEEAEARAADDAMLAELGSLLKPSLSKLQRGQALAGLKQKVIFRTDNQKVCITYFELITKYGYNTPDKWEDKYTRNGDLRAKPVNHYYVKRGESCTVIEVPGRLGSLFNFG